MRGAHRPSYQGCDHDFTCKRWGSLLAHNDLFGNRGEPRFVRFLMRTNQVEVCGDNKQCVFILEKRMELCHRTERQPWLCIMATSPFEGRGLGF
jgi:hypothetical protein